MMIFINILKSKEFKMFFSDDIEEIAKAGARGEETTFVITKKNKYTIALFCYYQVKHKTLKEFKHISYQKPKDLFYYFLKTVSKLSFGEYHISYDYSEKS